MGILLWMPILIIDSRAVMTVLSVGKRITSTLPTSVFVAAETSLLLETVASTILIFFRSAIALIS